MWVRGAPLIGATAAYGVALEMQRNASDAALDAAWEQLHDTRPTAINLRWALDEMRQVLAASRKRTGRPAPSARPRRFATRMSRPTA
jgi:methylthioribose-1-phosphate isomerase